MRKYVKKIDISKGCCIKRKDYCIKKAIANSAKINYEVSGNKKSNRTNITLINILDNLPRYPKCEVIVLDNCIAICKNSSIIKKVKVINITGEKLRYEILDYPKKGFVIVDRCTGIWKYTSKVGAIGIDNFTIKITTSLGSEFNSKITINLLNSICC